MHSYTVHPRHHRWHRERSNFFGNDGDMAQGTETTSRKSKRTEIHLQTRRLVRPARPGIRSTSSDSLRGRRSLRNGRTLVGSRWGLRRAGICVGSRVGGGCFGFGFAPFWSTAWTFPGGLTVGGYFFCGSFGGGC